MSEETWKFQSSFKTGSKGQNMHNVRGEDFNEYVEHLKAFAESYGKIAEIEALIDGASFVAESLLGSKPATPSAAPAAAPASNVHANPNTNSPVCAHGEMVYKTGTGAKGPWKAWMCTAPKGQTCTPIWDRG